jgi:FkbM family methyltransferase
VATWTGKNACSVSEILAGNKYIQNRTKSQASLQAASRRAESGAAGLTLWETPRGRFWMPQRSDGYIIPLLAEQENNLYGTGEWGVHAGDIVLDCGANIGVFTEKALSSGAKLVVAIEVAPDNIECLRRTFEKQILGGSVIVYPKGVWDKDDLLELDTSYSSLDDSVVFHRSPGTSGIKVPLTTIDKLVSDLKLPRIDFIKMDIEGAERQALTGARQTIVTYHPQLAIATEHIRDDAERIPELVHGMWAGYQKQCGPCYAMFNRIQPDVDYFRSPRPRQ